MTRRRNAAVWVHRVFQIGVALKGLDGVIEVGAAAALLGIGPQRIQQTLASLVRGALSNNPDTLLTDLLIGISRHVSAGSLHFATAYLLVHGLVKVGLVIGLLKGVKASYPVALVIISLFICYQLYRLAHLPSIGLAALTIFDAFIVGLIWWEWRHASKPGEESNALRS